MTSQSNRNSSDLGCHSLWRRHPESNRGIKVLQTSALPLGYGAVLSFVKKTLKAFDSFKRLLMERVTRLELATSTLARWRSTRWAKPALFWCLRTESNHRHGDFQSPALPTELQRHFEQETCDPKWRPGWGSNPRPLAWQASVLTNWTTGPYLVGTTGLEPVTLCL